MISCTVECMLQLNCNLNRSTTTKILTDYTFLFADDANQSLNCKFLLNNRKLYKYTHKLANKMGHWTLINIKCLSTLSFNCWHNCNATVNSTSTSGYDRKNYGIQHKIWEKFLCKQNKKYNLPFNHGTEHSAWTESNLITPWIFVNWYTANINLWLCK